MAGVAVLVVLCSPSKRRRAQQQAWRLAQFLGFCAAWAWWLAEQRPVLQFGAMALVGLNWWLSHRFDTDVDMPGSGLFGLPTGTKRRATWRAVKMLVWCTVLYFAYIMQRQGLLLTGASYHKPNHDQESILKQSLRFRNTFFTLAKATPVAAPGAAGDGAPEEHADALRELCSLWSCAGAAVHGMAQFARAPFRASASAALDAGGGADGAAPDVRRSIVFMLSSILGGGRRRRAGAAAAGRGKTCALFLTREDYAAADEVAAALRAVGGTPGAGLLKLQEAAMHIRMRTAAGAGPDPGGGGGGRGPRARPVRGGAVLRRRHAHALPAPACSLLRPQGKLLSGIVTLKKRLQYQPAMLRLIEYARGAAPERSVGASGLL